MSFSRFPNFAKRYFPKLTEISRNTLYRNWPKFREICWFLSRIDLKKERQPKVTKFYDFFPNFEKFQNTKILMFSEIIPNLPKFHETPLSETDRNFEFQCKPYNWPMDWLVAVLIRSTRSCSGVAIYSTSPTARHSSPGKSLG